MLYILYHIILYYVMLCYMILCYVVSYCYGTAKMSIAELAARFTKDKNDVEHI